MKKLLIIAFAVASLATAFTSCKKDVSEEELLKNQLAQADSLLKRGGVIKYTVKVVSTANSSMLKSKMSIENADVTVYQNDKVFTGQTDAMGFVTFDNMRVGTVAVSVTLKDHAEVDYVADITPQEQLTNLSQSQVVNTIRYASTMVPMFPIADPGCATITGKVTAELDLTNTTPEPAPGVKVTAMVDVDDPDFVSRYIAPTLSSGTPSAGRILKYAFSDATINATTDTQGVYTLKVPASINGLPIKLSVDDYQANQKLYLENNPTTGSFAPGEYTVPVLFSSNVEPSEIPVVKPIYVMLDEPTGNFGITYKPASISFNSNVDGTITNVTINEKGKYSTKPDLLLIGSGNGAQFDVNFNSNTGEIESVSIINGGSGYFNNSTNMIFVLQSNKTKAIIEPLITKDGYIYNFKITNNGQGYITSPNISMISFKNSVLPDCSIRIDLWNQKIDFVRVLKEGKNIPNSMNIPILAVRNTNLKQINTSSTSINVANYYLGTGMIFK